MQLYLMIAADYEEMFHLGIFSSKAAAWAAWQEIQQAGYLFHGFHLREHTPELEVFTLDILGGADAAFDELEEDEPDDA